ncbi:hypothetical protein L9W97_01830 [Vibrio aestuarianus]|uniref:hypothetical protein n=1 Tax=Vibrio aestuarianus TaxID=28171 RepID=UPI00237CC2F7|nr:hypothetical protein [Vibrio aestuarianus]MDE1323859.1 hypothetical protein [Vibrio aestuarianus]
MTVSPQLEKRLIDLGFVVLGGVVVWYITAKIGNKIDTVTKQATQPAAELISDLMAGFNGWEAVQLQPLLIRDSYLNPDYTLTPEASATLWKIEQYQPLMLQIFGHQGGVMAAKYRPLINQPIGK